MLVSLSYQSVLSRGYAVVRDANGATVRAAAQVSGGQKLELEFHDGRINAEAEGTASKDAAKPLPPPQGGPARGQGSLF